MGFLKVLVIGMGVLIVTGVVFVGVLISKKISPTSVLKPPLSITMPRGTLLSGVSHEENSIALWDQTQGRIFIYDRKQGHLIQEVLLKTAD